jgi:hypothetical protein
MKTREPFNPDFAEAARLACRDVNATTPESYAAAYAAYSETFRTTALCPASAAFEAAKQAARKTANTPRPHGYPDNPRKGCFYSLTGKAEFTGQTAAKNSAGDSHALVRVGEHVAKWSNAAFLPQIGERVQITFNGLGCGTVVAYFVEDTYIGVEVAPDKRPEWHVKQNGNQHPHPLVFGAEIKPEQSAQPASI